MLAQVGSAEVDTMIARYRRLAVDSLRQAPIQEALRASRAIGYHFGEARVLFDRGKAYYRTGQYDEAMRDVLSARSLFVSTGHEAHVQASTNQLGTIQFRLRDYDSARMFYREFLLSSIASGDQHNTASAHYNLGLCYARLGPSDSAIYHYEQSRLLRKRSGQVKKELKTVKALSSLYYARDQFDSARSLLKDALRLDDGSRDSTLFALIYFELGRISYRTSDLVDALTYYQEAYARRGNAFLVDSYYQNVGLIYSAIEDHERAAEYYRKALGLRRERGDSVAMAESYQAIGSNLLRRHMDSVEWYYDRALGIFERQEFQPALSSMHENMGYYYFIMDEFEAAKEHYLLCINIGDLAETQGDIYLAKAYLGKMAQVEGAYKRAEALLTESNRWFLEKGIRNHEMTTSGFLGELYADLGQYRRAYAYQQREKELNREILSARNITEIAVLRYRMTLEQEEETSQLIATERERMYQANLAMERRMRNIAVASVVVAILIIIYILRLVMQRRKINQDLNRQNEQLNTLASHLTDTLREKETLYKEIHHRVKNNLQIILSLLNSAQVMVEDQESRDVLQQTRNRVNSMALIHKNLYQSGNMEKVHAHRFIQEIVREIEQSFAGKKAIAQIDTQVEDTFLELNLAIPVGLILNELITNAFKYAFDANGQNKMRIELKRLDDKTYRVEVEDNGPGLPEGFSPSESEKLGFQLIYGLTRQINGEFRYHSNHGLNVQVDFCTEQQ